MTYPGMPLHMSKKHVGLENMDMCSEELWVLSCSPPFPLDNAILQPRLCCPNTAQLSHDCAAVSEYLRQKKNSVLQGVCNK